MSVERDNPWKTLGTREVYANPWIRVREDRVLCPSGEEGVYGVVETRLAVGVLALNDDKDLYLVGQYRYPIERYTWEIIEGGSEAGEAGLVTAQRELEEETGLTAGSWRKLGGDIQLSNCFSSEIGILYVATDLVEGRPNPDDTEVLQVKRVPFVEALELVLKGDIQDGLSIIGIMRLAREFGL